jgi:YD repeat-containing protein
MTLSILQITWSANLEHLARAHGYDAAERMSTVLDWTNRTATYTYNRADQITRLVYGNASTADYTYDIAGRLTSLINKQSNGNVISSHTDTLDAFGNITQADEILPLQPTLTPRIKRWTVDDANRVLTDSVSGDSFEHDTAGRLIRQVVSGATTGFTYNDLDLLTTLTAPGRTESYRYNGQGHRLERTVNGVATRYLVEPNGVMPNTIAQLNSGNVLQRAFVFGASGLLAQIDSNGFHWTYHFAPIGHTLALTDGSGNISDRYVSLPTGETYTGTTNLTPNPFRFLGRLGVIDDENGIQSLRHRSRSIVTAGRFMSRDPIRGALANPQSWADYSYAEGRLLTLSDATGLAPQNCTGQLTKQCSWEALSYSLPTYVGQAPLTDIKVLSAKADLQAFTYAGVSASVVFVPLSNSNKTALVYGSVDVDAGGGFGVFVVGNKAEVKGGLSGCVSVNANAEQIWFDTIRVKGKMGAESGLCALGTAAAYDEDDYYGVSVSGKVAAYLGLRGDLDIGISKRSEWYKKWTKFGNDVYDRWPSVRD